MDTTGKRIPLIIDADPGVDDTLALKMAFESELLDVKLLCSVAGNVNLDLTTANSLYLTKKYGGDIPVARGGASPLARDKMDASAVHGAGGVGNYKIPRHGYTLDFTDGVQAIWETLCGSDQKCTLVTFGPMTNVARLFALHPDAVGRIERIFAMIAAVDGTGNITPYAEFNAYCDPDSLDAVVRSGVEIVFAPMHLGREARLSTEALLRRSAGTEFGEMLSQIFSGYRDSAAGEGYVAMYDANAVAAVLHPSLYDFVRCTPEVNTTDFPGQTFLRADDEGHCFYLEIKDTDALTEAMLDDMFR